jgi:hypothetical protein
MTQYIRYPTVASPAWRQPVANAAALPSIGNNAGDVIVTLDTFTIYIWHGNEWVTG